MSTKLDTVADYIIDKILSDAEYQKAMREHVQERAAEIGIELPEADKRDDHGVYWLIANEYLMSLLARIADLSATKVK